MKRTIYKYQLSVTDFQTVNLPVGAQILTIQSQYEIPCLWALVDPDEIKRENRSIEIFGTGHPMNNGMGTDRNYLATFQMNEGRLVFHAFEYTGI